MWVSGCAVRSPLLGAEQHAGHITIVDDDVVEASNLARQILHTDSRVGMPKAESACIAGRA